MLNVDASCGVSYTVTHCNFTGMLTLFPGNTILAAAGGQNVLIYFNQSNSAGKMIVLGLLVFSLLAWTVMVGKYLDLRDLRKRNTRLQKAVAGQDMALNPDRQLLKTRGPFGDCFRQAVEAFHRHDKAAVPMRVSFIENALQRSVAEGTIQYESKMVLLGSIVTGAPFLGLLGTVWGVMDAFGGIAGSGGASIQMLAPGVSGALLTTVAGLLVAIPSVFGYNFLLTQTKLMITELENFASALADRLEVEAQAWQQ